HSRPFVTGDVDVENVAWTPDGRGVSFTAKRANDKHASLYVIPIDGGEARRILTHETDIGAYSWRHDGKEIAFIATADAPKSRRDLKDKGFAAEIVEEKNINAKVWTAAPDSEAPARSLELQGSASSVEWTPAGTQLIVALAPSPRIDDNYMNRKLHV